MDQRGHARPDPAHQDHQNRHRQRGDREDVHRSAERDQSYAALRTWAHPEARPRPDQYQHQHQYQHQFQYQYQYPEQYQDQYPHMYSAHLYSYVHPEQRPQSRSGYDCSSRDLRDNRYGHEHRGRHDPGPWSPQDWRTDQYQDWRTDQYQDWSWRPEREGSCYSQEHSRGLVRDVSQLHSDYEENSSRDLQELSSQHPGTLESSKLSGLSSSSYELSQYMNGAELCEADRAPVRSHQVSAPLKFSIPHTVVSFGPAGQLIRVGPGQSTQENVNQLEIHSLEMLLSHTEQQQQMRTFPGPLIREELHKAEAMEFGQQRAAACDQQDGAALLWRLLVLLCRQNGQVVGSDIAELLLQSSRSDAWAESNVRSLIDFSEGPAAEEEEAPVPRGDDLLTGSSSSSQSSDKALQGYTQLLLKGRKKEALEAAMNSGLWGHALFLASKMDNRSYSSVLNRFTGQLSSSDPLQTLFQLLSGRIPAVSAGGGEGGGDWRPHLAVMLSNETGDPRVQQRAVVTLGDTLASRGKLHAAHICYLTAGVSFGSFTQKTDRLVLLGSSHRTESFRSFASDSSIQCTELFEYSQSLGGNSAPLPSFQVYKFLYAVRLLDCGLVSQAFHYCEVVARALLRQWGAEPEPLRQQGAEPEPLRQRGAEPEPLRERGAEPELLMSLVLQMSDRLRVAEETLSDAGQGRSTLEPDWLRQLRAKCHSIQTGCDEDTETLQPPPAVPAEAGAESRVCAGPDEEDGQEQQGLEPASGGGSEEVTSWDISGAQPWPPAAITQVYVPPAPGPPASEPGPPASEGSGLHAASPPRPAAGTEPCTDAAAGSQASPSLPLPGPEKSEDEQQLHKQSSRTGWFSGWFRPKPGDVQHSSDPVAPPRAPPPAGQTPTTPPGSFRHGPRV